MKKLYLLVIVLITITSSFAQTSGGPDLYGYVWRNSLDTSSLAPVYQWIDVDALGGAQQTISALQDDNSAGWYTFGFDFQYYWGKFSKVRIGSNGWISFDNTANIASPFPTIPLQGGTAGDNYLAPLLCDLSFFGVGDPAICKFWTNYKDTCVITYNHVPYWIANPPGYDTGDNQFQVFICGKDSSITFNYKHISPFPVGGANAVVVGIENIIGNMGFMNYLNVLPDSNFSIKYYCPHSTTYQVTDYSAEWNQNTQNAADVHMIQDIIPLSTQIKNTGNQDVTSTVMVTMRVSNPNNTVVYQEADTIYPLDVNDSVLIHFSAPFVPLSQGTYTIESDITYGSDQNQGNNTIQTELVVVDTFAQIVTIGYGGTGIGTGQVQWQGGGAGVGIYMKPPYYPFTIDGLEYNIAFASDTNGFYAQVYDDDGVGGTAGTMVYDSLIPGNTIAINTYKQILFNQPVTINSGAFYVAWMMQGTLGAISETNNIPISNRTYEVLGGTWTTYRDREANDFMINVLTLGTCDINPVIIATTPTTVCAPDTVHLVAPPGFVAYSWSNGATSQSIDANASGTYFCTVLSSGNCYDASNSIAVTILDATPSVSLNGNTLTSSSAVSYQWYLDGAIIVGATSQSYTISQNGTYFVVVVDANGCTGTSSSYYVEVGIEELSGISSFEIYPNPVTYNALVEFNLANTAEIKMKVTDELGRVIYSATDQTSPGTQHKEMDLRSFSSGVYFISLEANDQRLSKKIVKM